MTSPHRSTGIPTAVPGVSANDPMFAFLNDHNATYINKSSATAIGIGANNNYNATGHASGQQQQPSYSVSKGLDQSAASDFRDTVLFLVHQQSQRHNELVGLVKGLAGDVGRLRKEVGAPATTSSTDNSTKNAASAIKNPSSHSGAAAVATDGVVGFEGSYASTQKAWVGQHAIAMSYVREEELEASRKRIDALERQVESLKVQVKAKDDTIRRLTDASVATLMSSQSTIALGANAAVRAQSLSRSNMVGAAGGAAGRTTPTRSVATVSVSSPSRAAIHQLHNHESHSERLLAASPILTMNAGGGEKTSSPSSMIKQPLRSSLKSST